MRLLNCHCYQYQLVFWRLLCLTAAGGVFRMGDEKKAREWIGEGICDMILSDVEAGTIGATQMRLGLRLEQICRRSPRQEDVTIISVQGVL